MLLRLLLARGRPYNFALALKVLLVASLMAAFLWGDYRIFRKLFGAARQIEALTPFFALGLIENLLGLLFLVGTFVLFFSAQTSSIGSFFNDLDLEIWHAAPVSRMRIAAGRLLKTFLQSSYLVILFLIPVILALQHELGQGMIFTLAGITGLLLLLITPVALAATTILLLVRFFPVRRVHQIAMTLAILVITAAVVGVRIARPERLFAEITTDDVAAVLQAIRLPAAERYPSTWLASSIVGFGNEGWLENHGRLALLAAGSLALFFLLAHASYFRAFVRARETSAPVALGAGPFTRLLDSLLARAHPQTRAMVGKEARMVSRDAAQWSQLFMMGALLFLYIYNIEMMPLEGDVRAVLLAYLNLGMSGFVVSAICLRFAYPSLSAEGKQFWLLESAPISIRRILWTKMAVYLIPLAGLGLLLVVAANSLLDAPAAVWTSTLAGSLLSTTALVGMGVGLGALAPDFRTENPTEVALSLGGLGYMAASMLYVGLIMFLMARPVQRLALRVIFGVTDDSAAWLLPIVSAALISVILAVAPIELAAFRFKALRRE
ncbi:MAG TPA: hypothetical protein VM557_02210 [Thermoanaerobaculia bacterium]|nr:hypothetical protein [Thermoanaerobaculia bacterium]